MNRTYVSVFVLSFEFVDVFESLLIKLCKLLAQFIINCILMFCPRQGILHDYLLCDLISQHGAVTVLLLECAEGWFHFLAVEGEYVGSLQLPLNFIIHVH